MYKRYGEVLLRLEEIGARAGKLNNSDRYELQSLLDEQEWLGTTIIKKAKSILEEIDGTYEKIFDWMIDVSDLIERAAGEAGTPEDLLALENIMDDVVKLNEQLRKLRPDKHPTLAVTKQAGNLLHDARFEVASATADGSATAEPLVVVPAKTGRPAAKKANKKSNKSKYMAGNEYQPPQELLVSIAEKIPHATQLRLLEDTKQFIEFNLPRPKE